MHWPCRQIRNSSTSPVMTGWIDIIDIAANKVVQSVPVAPNPHWVTFDATGKNVYIANHDSNVVSVLDTATNTEITTIPVGTSPHSIAVSPDGTQVAVVCFTATTSTSSTRQPIRSLAPYR